MAASKNSAFGLRDWLLLLYIFVGATALALWVWVLHLVGYRWPE